jgi:predicted nuclease of restriction endonuclease-like (RecB) superfamily
VSDNVKNLLVPSDELFARVAAILEAARGNVVRAVNTNMVVAYWLIGREIVEQVQRGEERAEYGSEVLADLSGRLQAAYGRGFSVPNLQRFRKLYLTYPERGPIWSPSGTKSLGSAPELQKSSPAGTKSGPLAVAGPSPEEKPFAPELTWSHYRALAHVESEHARDFYEREAIECGWSKAQLERQIQSSLYQRILANHGEEGFRDEHRERLPGEPLAPKDVLRSPLVLEFLELPDTPSLHESSLEQAIIDDLQGFMLELGKGFAFVARQKHIRFDDDFYIDLVFYNYLLKCFLLVDLKIGKLSHQDVGQRDGYVRLFEKRFKVEGDNPTIGLILCSDKSESVAKYSVLSEGKQIFAAKYLQFLPTEEELARELERERRLLEERSEEA